MNNINEGASTQYPTKIEGATSFISAIQPNATIGNCRDFSTELAKQNNNLTNSSSSLIDNSNNELLVIDESNSLPSDVSSEDNEKEANVLLSLVQAVSTSNTNTPNTPTNLSKEEKVCVCCGKTGGNRFSKTYTVRDSNMKDYQKCFPEANIVPGFACSTCYAKQYRFVNSKFSRATKSSRKNTATKAKSNNSPQMKSSPKEKLNDLKRQHSSEDEDKSLTMDDLENINLPTEKAKRNRKPLKKQKKDLTKGIVDGIEEIVCFVCHKSERETPNDLMLTCKSCGFKIHLKCYENEHFSRKFAKDWECIECKCCNVCGGAEYSEGNEILFCNRCDKGFHQLCCPPKFRTIPKEDKPWFCEGCYEYLKQKKIKKENRKKNNIPKQQDEKKETNKSLTNGSINGCISTSTISKPNDNMIIEQVPSTSTSDNNSNISPQIRIIVNYILNNDLLYSTYLNINNFDYILSNRISQQQSVTLHFNNLVAPSKSNTRADLAMEYFNGLKEYLFSLDYN
ncbi:hypothetical protein ABK040_003878 [Willaertia magna]